MEEYDFEVGVLGKNGEELDVVFICAKSEAEMWDIFDEDYRPDYPEYDNAVIYDVYLA